MIKDNSKKRASANSGKRQRRVPASVNANANAPDSNQQE
jgi:hypothetical protein